MRTSNHTSRPPLDGFALPAVLIIVSALLILAVGVMAISGIERRTARSYVDLQRADLAARSGLEEVKALLNREAANDDFLIIQSRLKNPVTAGRASPDYLFIARGETKEGSSYNYRLRPLFSNSSSGVLNLPSLKAPDVDDMVGADGRDRVDMTTRPYLDSVRTAWVPIEDDQGRTVGRYAYWVEDLQARLDPLTVGNDAGEGGSHLRAAYPFPAPGLNPEDASNGPPLNQVAMYAVDPEARGGNQGGLAKRLLEGRNGYASPDSLLAMAGIEPPLTRDDEGRLTDPQARAVEENLAAAVSPYFEQPLVPFVEGIDPSVAGKPKLNLNRILAAGDGGVDVMADFIDSALPDFVARKGGFPENYLKTLAANAIDYADIDPSSSLEEGSHRGLDSYPLVSEFLMRFRWDGLVRENGRVYVLLSASTYVELWNMTDQEISGEAEVSYETKYEFPLGANPSITLDDLDEAEHNLTELDGFRWFPPIPVTLLPNQYLILNCGTVKYKIDAGPASLFVPSPVTLGGEQYGASGAGYRLRWNRQLIDAPRGGIHRNDSNLHFPSATLAQATRTTLPAHSHTRQGVYRNNMGDPRMAYYNEAPQDPNIYPGNYSPNRRTIRWETVYKTDGATKTKVHGRVLPSEWPDGGHNSFYGSNGFQTTDVTVLPDDPRFFTNLPKPRREDAPMRLSNRGRFLSATELGRVYDPIMWNVAMPSGPGLPWGDVTLNTLSSPDFGGGNTLRIGRPEHPRFAATPGMHAVRLLDLFHAGISGGDELDPSAPVAMIWGHVNINTATRDTLKALIAGPLTMDPLIGRRTTENHETNVRMAPPVQLLDSDTRELPSERIVDAIIRSRPFASPADLAMVRDASGELVFGNRSLFALGTKIQWTDSAAEELFARAYEASTVRSRNFRVWVVGQSLAPLPAGSTGTPQVLAEARKVFTVFAHPGLRDNDGTLNPAKTGVEVRYENDF
jgi:hypothetical protein